MFGQHGNQDQQQQQPWQPPQGDQFNGQQQPTAPVDNNQFQQTQPPQQFNGFPGAPAPSPTQVQVDQPSAPEEPTTAPTPPPAPRTTITNDDLLAIKQDALQQLSPLVGHLEQSPEEKFRTTMMMIQAADDQSLLQTAYDLAKQITDEKVRAQALLDVVNEINYFTQQHNNA